MSEYKKAKERMQEGEGANTRRRRSEHKKTKGRIQEGEGANTIHRLAVKALFSLIVSCCDTKNTSLSSVRSERFHSFYSSASVSGNTIPVSSSYIMLGVQSGKLSENKKLLLKTTI